MNTPPFDLLKADFRKPAQEVVSKELHSCCGSEKKKFDFLLWGSLCVMVLAALVSALDLDVPPWLLRFSTTCYHLFAKSWWAILGGILSMAILSQMPKQLVGMLLGRAGTWSGIIRATAAGLLLDLCNHGILLVAMGLYKRGASLGQTLAFLIASPWNSLSMTLLLSALIGWHWMLIFVLLSALVGILTGYLVECLTKRGILPRNPHSLPQIFSLDTNIAASTSENTPLFLWKKFIQQIQPRPKNIYRLVKIGISDSRMVLRWIFFGFVMTAAVKAFVPNSWVQSGFAATISGLFLTLLVTSVLEVCSEGSSPLAADIFHTAQAPGNAFVFLMAGAATDYTEVMALKQTTKKWICALMLPILTLPQITALGWLLNR